MILKIIFHDIPLNHSYGCEEVAEQCQLITFAESLGRIESLITIPYYQNHADVELAQRHRLGITPKLLRLSVGLENPTDLIADLRQVLAD